MTPYWYYQVITESGGPINLTSAYCTVCTGHNLSYVLPLSPYLPDRHVTLLLELASRGAVLSRCSPPQRRGLCPASNEIEDDELPPPSPRPHNHHQQDLTTRATAAAPGGAKWTFCNLFYWFKTLYLYCTYSNMSTCVASFLSIIICHTFFFFFLHFNTPGHATTLNFYRLDQDNATTG